MALTAMEPCEALPQPKSKAAIHFVDSSCKKAHTACDRCRMKKSKVGMKDRGKQTISALAARLTFAKCDGARPCSRCRAKNFACVTQLRHKARPNAYTREFVSTFIRSLHVTTSLTVIWPADMLKLLRSSKSVWLTPSFNCTDWLIVVPIGQVLGQGSSLMASRSSMICSPD